MLDGCMPWPEEFARRYRTQGYWEGITLDEMLRRSAQRRPDALAVVDGARSATYAQLVERIDRLAANLSDLGLRSRDRAVFPGSERSL